MAEKRFFPGPATAGPAPAADELYTSLSTEPGLAPLHGFMKRNYAAALQDDAQQTLNEWLKTSQNASLEAIATERLPQKVFTEKVRSYPRCLDRAAELLGSKHYMYAALKARQYFFEGFLLANSNRNPDTELGERALGLFRLSLAWQPEQPQVYWQMSMVFGFNLSQLDSLEHYTRKAMEIYPNWILPLTETASLLCYRYGQFDRARPLLEQANLIDSNASEVLNSWAIYYFNQKNFSEAELQLKKAVALDSTNIFVWSNLGLCYNQTNRYPEAEQVLKKAIALDSTNAFSWNVLGMIYQQTRRYAEAEPALKRAIALDSTDANAWNNLGFMYNQTRGFTEAEQALKRAITLDSTYFNVWNNLGYLYNITNRFAEAESAFKKAITLDSTDFNVWNNLGYLYNITNRFAEAESAFKKAIALDSTFANPRKHLGMVCFKTSRPDEARQHFLEAIALNPNYAGAMLGMAYLFAEALAKEDTPASAKVTACKEAIGYVEQAIGKGTTFEQLESDEDLGPLREQAEWKELMKKYFPDKGKD